jgi:hypothetical protein
VYSFSHVVSEKRVKIRRPTNSFLGKALQPVF